MAKATPMKLGMADDVLHDVDFQKQLQPELDDALSKIDNAGLREEYNAFLSTREGNEIEAEKTIAFIEQYNSSVDINALDKEVTKIDDLLKSDHPTIDIFLSKDETKTYLSELNVNEVDGNFYFKDENNSDILIDKEYLFLALKEATEEVSFQINDDGNVILVDKNENEIIIDNYDEKIASLEKSDDIYKEGLNVAKDQLEDKIEQLQSSPKEMIDISDLSSKLDSVKDKAKEIDSIIEKGDNYSHLSRTNFFKEYAKVERMMLAREYGMKFEGGYVTKTEIFLELRKLANSGIIEGLLEIALYKVLDHIESKEDFERYKETGTVDKPENNNDVTGSNVDNDTDNTDKNNVATNTGSTVEKESGTDNKDKPDNDKITVKIGNFEIDKTTKIDLKEGKLQNGDGKSIDIADVKGKIGNIEVSGNTWKSKDGTDRYGVNIVRGQHGEALIKDKIVLEVKGKIDKGIELNSGNAEVLKTGTDKTGNDRYLGIDREATMGYVVYDPQTDKSEYLNCKFEHIAGEKFGIETSDLRLSKDQSTLQDDRLDYNVVDKFTDKFIEKISPSDTEIKDKIDSINEKIIELNDIKDNVDLSDTEKTELDEKILELESEKQELESFLQPDKDPKTEEEKIELAEHKSEICNSDIKETQTEKDHKDDIDKIKSDKIESRIIAIEKTIEKTDTADNRKELSELRKEYIDNSSLSDKDKATLSAAIRDDIKGFDIQVSNKDFDNKEKCSEIVQKIYGREIEKTPDITLRSDICNDAKDSIKNEIEAKKEEIEAKKADIEDIKKEYGSQIEVTSDYIDNLKTQNNAEITYNKDNKDQIEQIVIIDKESFKSDKTGNEYKIDKETILTFEHDKGSIHIESTLKIDGEESKDSYECRIPLSDNQDKIETGINDAIDKIKNDPDLKGKGEAVATIVENHKEEISKVFESKAIDRPDPESVSKIIIEAIHSSGVDFGRKESQIKGFLENNPIERTIEKGFDGKNINGQQLAKDNPLKIACEEIKITDTSVNDVSNSESENLDNQKYADIWNNLVGTEKDKIDAVGHIIDGILQNAVNNGDIEPNEKDNIAINIQLEMTDLDLKNDSESNAKIFSDAMSKMDSDTNIPISAEQFTETLKEYAIETKNDPTEQVTNKDTPNEYIELPKIDSYTDKTDLEEKQNNLTTAYIEGNFEAADYLTNIMSDKDEAVDDDGVAYNTALVNGDGGIIENIDQRIDAALDSIARYAEKNPDNADQIAGAIVKIAEVSTDSLCKIAETANNKISLSELPKDKQEEIIRATYNKIETAIEKIYDVEINKNDIDINEATSDQIDAAENQVINVVSAIVDIIVPKEDTDVKDKIEAALQEAKTCKSSNDPVTARKEFLEKVSANLESITDKLSDHIKDNVDFDLDNVSHESDEPKDVEHDNPYDNNDNIDEDDENVSFD